jgi:hypothetical protein
MIAWILAAGRAIRASRQWLTLVVVAAIGAWLYVQYAETRADRDRLLAQADVICAAAGEPLAASIALVDGKSVTVARGIRCRQKVAGLVAFRDDTERQSAQALAAAMQEREGKAAIDARAARDAADALVTATERMEQADAEAERRNRLDRDWWLAFNDLAGLRAPAR